jgi:hypothetical protein
MTPEQRVRLSGSSNQANTATVFMFISAVVLSLAVIVQPRDLGAQPGDHLEPMLTAKRKHRRVTPDK